MGPSAVRHLEITLQRLGFFNGPLSGFYGPLTQAAVTSFQRSVGLNAGLFGSKTAAALRRADSTTGTLATSPGSAALPAPAGWVRRLQRDLARFGYFHHVVTGVYGPIMSPASTARSRQPRSDSFKLHPVSRPTESGAHKVKQP
jgi:peptidoglycan hydrolase-like protein with peptidoglycan-binding domain